MQPSTELDKFGRPLPPPSGKYYIPSITTDAVVIRTNHAKKLEILLVRRKFEPFKGCLALPGGFVEYNEDPQDACLRELKEEANINGLTIQLLCVRGDPQRDPRKHVITIAYNVTVHPDAVPEGGDDAESAAFYDLNLVLNRTEKVAFDHLEIIKCHPLALNHI